jgi:hypothetical protein
MAFVQVNVRLNVRLKTTEVGWRQFLFTFSPNNLRKSRGLLNTGSGMVKGLAPLSRFSN